MKKILRQKATNCESCVFYDYDEYLDAYICTVNLDEDELERFVKGTAQNCPKAYRSRYKTHGDALGRESLPRAVCVYRKGLV